MMGCWHDEMGTAETGSGRTHARKRVWRSHAKKTVRPGTSFTTEAMVKASVVVCGTRASRTAPRTGTGSHAERESDGRI